MLMCIFSSTVCGLIACGSVVGAWLETRESRADEQKRMARKAQAISDWILDGMRDEEMPR